MPASQKVVKLKLAEFDEITAAKGWDTDAKRCQNLGLTQPKMSQIRKRPIVGATVIHKIMAGIDAPYLRLFEEFDRDEYETEAA